MKFLKSRSKEIKELQPEPEQPQAGKPEAEPGQGSPEEGYQPPAKLPEIKKTLKPVPRAMPAQSPPIFIKVEKYREIIKGMRDLRSYILNLRDTLDVLVDMQRELANGIEIAQKTLDELGTILSGLDSLFIKPAGMEGRQGEYGGKEDWDNDDGSSGVQTSMQDVYGHLEKLRAQLKAIS